MNRALAIACIATVTIGAGAAAVVLTGGDYEVPWTTSDIGGGASVGADYELGITFGQQDSEILTGGDYVLEGGFWPGPEPGNGVVLGLDVRPGSCPNLLNMDGHGVLQLAVLGREGFDVTTIDASSLAVSRADGVGGVVMPSSGPGPFTAYEDVATPYLAEAGCHDLGGDGFLDLSIPFRTDALVNTLQLDQIGPGAAVELKLTGSLMNGDTFTAFDWLDLAPPCASPAMIRVRAEVDGQEQFDAWVDVWPPDDLLDTGGFASFERCFGQDTSVSLQAEPTYRGVPFAGWRIDGRFMSAADAGSSPTGTLECLVRGDGEMQEIIAVYGGQSRDFGGRR